MFEFTSRYASIETATLILPDGRVVAYKRRRFLPDTSGLPTLAEVIITEGDRLDLIANNILGDPELFWRVCDSNTVLDPRELTAEPGRTIRIVVPQAG